jgi:hypothetical protein
MSQDNDTTRIPDTSAEETTWTSDWQRPAAEDTEDAGAHHEGFHPLQTGYLVLGLLAIGTALMWLLSEQDVMAFGDGSVAFSVVLITAGAVGLVASLGRALRRR